MSKPQLKPLLKYFFIFIGSVVLIGFILPEPRVIPVENATSKDWNKDTYWYEPWGSSGVHKGIDIFSKEGTPVIASNNQLILYKGNIPKGGNVVITLGPKWRLHYYAHLATIDTNDKHFISSGSKIGTVGTTGNAQGKAAHLHYSIVSVIPLLWLMDTSTQGYKKAFYLDPIHYLTNEN